MNRSRWIVLAAIVVVVAGGLLWKSRSKPDAPKFRTAVIERGAVESVVSATGTVRPVVQVEVGSQVSGTVNKLYTDYNARVKAGQVLCQLEPSSFRARSAQAEASVARAEVAVKEGRRQLARARELVKDNYVSQADVEAAEVALEQRLADLKQASAQLDAAQVDLANSTIRAPIDGVVIARSIDVGQTVAASLQAPRLFVIANDLSQMQVETRIDEADIGRIHPGLPVTFTVDAFPDLTFEGRVTQVRLEPIVEQGVVTYTTVIHTRNDDLRLRPGMTANVTVQVAQKDDVLKVPAAALRFQPPAEARGRGWAESGARALDGAPGASAATRADDQRSATSGGAAAGAGEPARGPSRRADAGSSAGGSPPAREAIVAQMKARGMTDEQIAQAMERRRESRGAGAPGGEASVAAAEPEVILKPGVIYLIRAGKPVRVPVMTGLTDGASVEVESTDLTPGDRVIVGLDLTVQNPGLQPPPGMGPGFGGRGMRGGRR